MQEPEATALRVKYAKLAPKGKSGEWASPPLYRLVSTAVPSRKASLAGEHGQKVKHMMLEPCACQSALWGDKVPGLGCFPISVV